MSEPVFVALATFVASVFASSVILWQALKRAKSENKKDEAGASDSLAEAASKLIQPYVDEVERLREQMQSLQERVLFLEEQHRQDVDRIQELEEENEKHRTKILELEQERTQLKDENKRLSERLKVVEEVSKQATRGA